MHADPLSEGERAKRGISTAEQLGRDDPLWPGQLAILAALLLYLALPPKLTIGPNWIVPATEAVLLVALLAATPRRGRTHKRRQTLAIGLLLVATTANLVALGLLSHYLVAGGHARGTDLIGGGVVIWCTNLLLFAIWYWELDRGGPLASRQGRPPVAPDFLFPPMTDERYAAPGWKPRFGDYLYVSLTNQTAFSPTDTMPLTPRAKLLMGVQGTASLITVGVIVARAVNILG
jgi:uncharacterized membrane protein